MTKEKARKFYKAHRKEIELVKQHGDIISKSMARALERYATEDTT